MKIKPLSWTIDLNVLREWMLDDGFESKLKIITDIMIDGVILWNQLSIVFLHYQWLIKIFHQCFFFSLFSIFFIFFVFLYFFFSIFHVIFQFDGGCNLLLPIHFQCVIKIVQKIYTKMPFIVNFQCEIRDAWLYCMWKLTANKTWKSDKCICLWHVHKYSQFRDFTLWHSQCDLLIAPQ